MLKKQGVNACPDFFFFRKIKAYNKKKTKQNSSKWSLLVGSGKTSFLFETSVNSSILYGRKLFAHKFESSSFYPSIYAIYAKIADLQRKVNICNCVRGFPKFHSIT